MVDHTLMKLGKAPAIVDDRTLKFADYTKKLAKAPETCNLTGKISDLGMMMNDTLGDCTCACVGHVIQQWTAEASTQVVLPDADILALYEQVGGYVPGDPSTDNGAAILDVLNYWKKNGVGGHSLGAYVSINPKEGHQLKDAVYYFGSSDIGLQLPISAQNQAIWDVDSSANGEPGSWGGHCVPIVAYDEKYLTVITWGEYQKMTWAFFEKYCDEVYGLFSKDWLNTLGKCPEGFDQTQLLADLSQITYS